jgi:hypothetical protein
MRVRNPHILSLSLLAMFISVDSTGQSKHAGDIFLPLRDLKNSFTIDRCFNYIGMSETRNKCHCNAPNMDKGAWPNLRSKQAKTRQIWTMDIQYRQQCERRATYRQECELQVYNVHAAECIPRCRRPGDILNRPKAAEKVSGDQSIQPKRISLTRR